MYLYGMVQRGFSIGCQPMDGFIERQDANGRLGINGREYWDVLVYDRELTKDELDNYSLEWIDKVELAERVKEISDPYENDGETLGNIYNDMISDPYYTIEYLLDLIGRIAD